MADFNIVIRLKKEDKENASKKRITLPVYISVAHNGNTRYIKTQFMVTEKGLKKITNRIGAIDYEVKDQFILKQCYDLIDVYVNKCNRIKIDEITCTELVERLKQSSSDISFTDFAKEFLRKMSISGRDRPARNYESALNSLISFSKKEELSFSDITSKLINEWIESLLNTKTAKRAYPAAIK